MYFGVASEKRKKKQFIIRLAVVSGKTGRNGQFGSKRDSNNHAKTAVISTSMNAFLFANGYNC